MTALIDLLNEEKRILNYIDVYESSITYQRSFMTDSKNAQYSIEASELEISIEKDTKKLEGYKRDLAKCRSKILEYFQSITSHSVTLNINRKGE